MRQVTALQCIPKGMRRLAQEITPMERRALIRYVHQDMKVARAAGTDTSELFTATKLHITNLDFTAHDKVDPHDDKHITVTLDVEDVRVEIAYVIRYEDGNPRLAMYSFLRAITGNRSASCSIRHDADGTARYEEGAISL